MRVCRYGLVTGVVQGVGFRAHAQRVARQAGLTGYAHNLPDGRVEVLLCGEADQVAKVELQVAVGPALAEVSSIQWESRACTPLDDFTTGVNRLT